MRNLSFLLISSIFIFLASCSTFDPQSDQESSATQEEKKQTQQISTTNLEQDKNLIFVNEEIVSPLADKQTNLWDKIPHLYQFSNSVDKNLSNIYKKRIAKEKKWYLDHPKYLYRVSERAQPYLYLIVEQIEQRNLPGELALLPIVESAYQPHAYSRGRAAGIWQFVPKTGKYFGLKQNWWYDGRRDIYAATNAALDYLEKLSKKFDNDWLLALAAYNAGEGTINKAIKRNRFLHKGTSFWELKLPKETRAYVPKLLALAEIIKELNTNKIKLLPIKNESYLELVDCENHIDLAVAAELAGISIEDLYKYNAGFNQWATDPDGPHHLLLPISAVKTLNKNLAKADKNDLIRWSQYKIKQGDSLSRIAKIHGVSVTALKNANRLKNSRIRAGKYLVRIVLSQPEY
jgi:membrane-bound lytic murein transglycosylase D